MTWVLVGFVLVIFLEMIHRTLSTHDMEVEEEEESKSKRRRRRR